MAGESLPYGGNEPNSGHAGSDTSRERAERDDRSGRTAWRQRAVLGYLDRRGPLGATWQEVANALGLHHGAASGALSNLHKDGRVARLNERRDRCKVYVAPRHVLDREVEPHGNTATSDLLNDLGSALRGVIPHGCRMHRAADPREGCRYCEAAQVLARWEARQ